jgi:hypothetical protein
MVAFKNTLKKSYFFYSQLEQQLQLMIELFSTQIQRAQFLSLGPVFSDNLPILSLLNFLLLRN